MGKTYRHFESKPCSSCGGSGRYSRCAMYGDTCFRCGTQAGVPGSGWALTAAGARAYAAYRAANTVTIPVADVAVGDRIVDGLRLWTVGAIEHGDFGARIARLPGGEVRIPFTVRLTDARETSYGRTSHLYEADRVVQVWRRVVDLPPEQEPGTSRAAEMRVYTAAARAAAASR